MPVIFSHISLLRKLYQYTTNGMVSSSDGLPSVQNVHISCSSPSEGHHLRCFPLCMAFPCSPAGRDSCEYYQRSVTLGSRP